MTLRGTLFGPTPYGEGVLKMAAKIALRGGMRSASSFHSGKLPYCNSPVLIGRRAGPKQHLKRSIEVSMHGPCRKCDKCLQFRRLRWRDRIEREFDAATARTWFLTLTFDPVRLAAILCEAHARNNHPDFYRRVDDVAYGHMQRFFKRLRKDGFQFRYFAVFERGSETGRPHYHALLHEGGLKPLTYRAMRDGWPSPIFHAKLVENSTAKITGRYLSKYLGKALTTRPRSSLHYGSLKKRNDTPFRSRH